MIKSFTAASVLLTLSACAITTPAYECGLEDNPNAKCASMEEAYAAAKRADPKAKATSVFGATASKAAREDSRPFFKGADSELPEPGQQGMPVFAQPKVHRVWVAPYVDADGNLRTGEYTYFSTPGKWNYGTTKTPGAAAGIFGPSKPNSLGFSPVEKKAPPAAALPKPSSPPNSVSGATANGNTTRLPTTDNGITAPYQKLSD